MSLHKFLRTRSKANIDFRFSFDRHLIDFDLHFGFQKRSKIDPEFMLKFDRFFESLSGAPTTTRHRTGTGVWVPRGAVRAWACWHGMQESRNAGIQGCRNLGMHEFWNAEILECRNSGIHECRSSGIQMCCLDAVCCMRVCVDQTYLVISG